MKRRDVVARSRRGARASGKQLPDKRDVISLYRPVQRRRTVRIGGVYVHTLREQLADGGAILTLDGLDERRSRLSGERRAAPPLP